MMQKRRRQQGSKGQITIFVVLIFQMLFVCMAMVINIGLVVHDKINLQNSVDLAAIYAAQRQAEILSAIAHINYQIRQSYKLLAWRYLVMGNIGANTHGGMASRLQDSQGERRKLERFQSSYALRDQAHCTNLYSACRNSFTNNTSCTLNDIKTACPYTACFWHHDWFISDKITTDKSHYCQEMSPVGISGGAIRRVYHPSTVPTAIGYKVGKNAIRAANIDIDASCENLGQINWKMAVSFYHLFQMDQWRRKVLILDLYENILQNKLDIEGQPIETGVERTIKNNLTFVNYRNFQDNRGSGIETKIKVPERFNKVFGWQEIDPILFYLDSTGCSPTGPCQGSLGKGICATTFADIAEIPKTITSAGGCSAIEKHLCDLAIANSVRGDTQARDPMHLSSGFYRKSIGRPEEDTFYVEVTAEIPYNRQIFFPFRRNITLRAKAYAKPFGAVFGPGQNADPLLPKPFDPNTNWDVAKWDHIPNHSLFPNDQLGLLSRRVQWTWAKAFKEIKDQKLDYCSSGGCRSSHGQKNLEDGKTMINYLVEKIFQDPMVIPYEHKSAQLQRRNWFNSNIRALEEMAIAPDLFDIAYYTILPNYMTTFYPKIVNNSHLRSTQNTLGLIPADLGHPAFTDHRRFTPSSSQPLCYEKPSPNPNQRNIIPFRLNYIEKQIKCSIYNDQQYMAGQSKYKIRNIDHLLTSWNPPEERYRSGPYDLQENRARFAQCEYSDHEVDTNISASLQQKLLPYHCLKGGRSGFSVKLFSPSIF